MKALVFAVVKRYWLQMVVVVVIIALCASTAFYRKSASSYKAAAEDAITERDSAKAELSYTIKMANLMHDITEATRNEKQDIKKSGGKAVVVIRKATEGDQCAVRVVPTAADDGLHQQLSELRSRAAAADKH